MQYVSASEMRQPQFGTVQLMYFTELRICKCKVGQLILKKNGGFQDRKPPKEWKMFEIFQEDRVGEWLILAQ